MRLTGELQVRFYTAPQDNQDAVLALIDQFESKVIELNLHPETGRRLSEIKIDKFRVKVIHKIYGIICEISPDKIEIITVRHFRQNFSDSKI